ncbi:MAG: hypothetical protein UX29_C0016G0005 [Parcubacteria group bacterium GW2011_GWA2_46_10]|nr:MAG: hypothetical protein UX29_C0016G0005 [Parcubacteria group bacterium GW2011_GWA2_46_10]
MKILGIDPGTTRTGYGLIEKDRGVKLLACGLIDGEGVGKENRLSHLEKGIQALINTHKPDLVCLERLFFSKNKKTASSVSEARGVILLVLQKSGVDFVEFSPSEVKSAVAGDGGAGKRDVLRAVMSRFFSNILSLVWTLLLPAMSSKGRFHNHLTIWSSRKKFFFKIVTLAVAKTMV